MQDEEEETDIHRLLLNVSEMFNDIIGQEEQGISGQVKEFPVFAFAYVIYRTLFHYDQAMSVRFVKIFAQVVITYEGLGHNKL